MSTGGTGLKRTTVSSFTYRLMNDSPSTAPREGALREAVRLGLASARENAIPGLILWVVAVAIVAGYYFLAPVTAALAALGRVKAEGGFLYSAISTAIAGGLIPFVWKRAIAARKRGGDGISPANGATSDASVGAAVAKAVVAPAWAACLFLCLFWAEKGIEVDFLYRMQARIFGDGNSPAVIIPKVIVDQFGYNPLWAGWTQVLGYWWLEHNFKPASLVDPALWRTMGPRVVTVLISTWGVWIPMVSVVYAMPGDLQIPLFNIALCFWGLMLASLTKERRAA